MRRLGGTPRIWRTDRLATVITPGTRDVQPSFAPVAKHYGAVVEPCPPRRGNRKGSVESAVRFTSGRWWQPMTARTPEEAQLSLDGFLAGPGDARERRTAARGRTTVGELADAEPLLALPPLPFPATVIVERVVAADATVAFRGNRYSVPPGLPGVTVSLRHRLSAATIEVHTAAGASSARTGSPQPAREHSSAPPSTGPRWRRSCCPPSPRPGRASQGQPAARPQALAEAARLLGTEGRDVTVDLPDYADLVEGTA